ncbi:SDR family oxidoreductase [Rothia nasisuis]|uniref:SDR family oxidoreductase n=1 Tax=Rothia nasisuis TaxID=2109647 RepID=UPI001F21AA9D|nr:SDR family oxidoreductase [Rothia nasisuis]
MTENWLGLEGRVVAVTGGASGIGAVIVGGLREAGARVAVLDINVETGEDAATGIFNATTDVTNAQSVRAAVASVIDHFGTLDGLVNNAGINLPRLLVDFQGKHPEYELDERSFDAMFNINVKGVFNCAQAAARHFESVGGGVIINITSEAGIEGSDGQSAYSATKGAVNSFTRSWGKELGKKNIRVVGVAPGINEPTGLTTPAYNEALAYTRNTTVEGLNTDYSKVIPLGRPGKLNELANTVVYLLSDRASYITGTTYAVTGGKSRG